MDLLNFSEQYGKSISDAIKVGALDGKTDLLLKDLMKTMGSEIKRKEDSIQRTAGEILQLKNMHGIILSLVKNHTRVEQANIDSENERQRLLSESTEEKKAKLQPKKTKKTTKKESIKSNTSTFVGDSSK